MKRVPSLALAVVLFHGVAATQTTWTRSGTLPLFLETPAQAYDEVRKQTVVFGGCGHRSSPSICGPGSWTLVFDGTQWTELSLIERPSARADHAMAFDRANGRVVLFGGFDSRTSQRLGDTWVWDGQSWTHLTPSVSPAARSRHVMAYDSARGRIVLFGGTGGPTETWIFEDQDWHLEPTPQSPPGFSYWMAYDEGRDRMVMVSPSAASGQVFEYDGTTWQTIQATSGAPNAVRGAGLAYDPFRGCCVFLVGATSTSTETWEWDGAAWTQRGATIPGQLVLGAMSYDRERRRVVHTGGNACNPVECTLVSATFEYSVTDPAVATGFGSGCAGSGAPLHLASPPPALPWLGSDFELALAPAAASPAVIAGLVGASRTQIGAVPLPLALGVLGRPDCFLLTSSEIAVPLAAVNGAASWTVPIPSESSLLGLSFFLQGLVLGDPTPGAIATSNGVFATLGAR